VRIGAVNESSSLAAGCTAEQTLRPQIPVLLTDTMETRQSYVKADISRTGPSSHCFGVILTASTDRRSGDEASCDALKKTPNDRPGTGARCRMIASVGSM
jgi:hypothetical protein